MKLYHSFESKNGFDLDNYQFDRGIFCLPAWKNKSYSNFTPNEFGDKVVEIIVNDSVKLYTEENSIELLLKLFPRSLWAKRLVNKFENGVVFYKKHWQNLDRLVGKEIKKRGYQIIHYTKDLMYGDVWVILDKSIIKSIRFEND